ncbi:MAG: type II toxin-antitoxin system Phd/YefM family antitoxin [Rhodanobacteraceae bacterium]
MRTINFSDARGNLKAVLDRVVADADVTIITRRDAEDVVVMSLAEWNSWQETNYLLASPANARRLTEALAQARTGHAKPRSGFPAHAP